MATKLIIGFFLKSTKEMSEDDMPHYGSEALFGSDEAGTASKLYKRHHLLAETRRDIRQTTVCWLLSISVPPRRPATCDDVPPG
jgi:hypothetical protein